MSSELGGQSVTDGERYVQSVQRVELPAPIREVVTSYEAAGGSRDRFLWRWIYDLLPTFTLSSVPEAHARSVRILKTKLTVFVTLLDDVAEQSGDARTFEAIRRFVTRPDDADGPSRGVDEDLVAFARDLWLEIEADLEAAPRHDEFRAIFEYDLRQVLNAMDYSRVLNDNPAMATLGGARRYDSHNMVVFPYSDVDVMHSPGFDRTDLGPTRDVLWDLQSMARIGNWLTTWKREVREGDFSSGVVVYALRNDLVSLSEVDVDTQAGRETLVDQIEAYRVEELFEAEWRQLASRVSERDYDADSVDLGALVEGMEGVMDHHLASEGYK